MKPNKYTIWTKRGYNMKGNPNSTAYNDVLHDCHILGVLKAPLYTHSGTADFFKTALSFI